MKHAVELAAPRAHRSEQASFDIGVLFTSPSGTLRALKTAATLSADLNGRISLIGVQVVPYPLPLERPQVYVDLLTERLRAAAFDSGVPVETHLYFGRDLLETLKVALHPETVLVIGSEKHGWASRERRLMRRLVKHGHPVVLAEQQTTSKHPLWGRLKSLRNLSNSRNHSLAGHVPPFG